MAELSNDKKRELARLLYLRENKTMQEIADQVGSTRQTISKWIKEGKWEEMRESLTTTNEEQIRHMQAQLTALNRKIMARPEEDRYGDNSEVDRQIKLTAAINNLQTKLSAQDAISVCTEILQFLRRGSLDLDTLKQTADILDTYVKSKL